MELNAEQIIKALECCLSGDDCTMCPLCDEQSCPCVLNENALSLIKELDARVKAQDITISDLRNKADKAQHDADRYAMKIDELAEENERLRGVGVPDNEVYIRLSDAKHAIMDYIGEQTVSKYASSAECKSARGGAEGAMNELDYLTPVNVAPIADTVRKMQERLKAQKFTHKNLGELVYVEDIDQIAKEMVEEG